MTHGPYFHVTQNEKDMCEECYREQQAAAKLAPSKSVERLALAQMVYEAVRFANFMAGEGICPADDCQEARDPAIFLSEYVTAIDGDDYEGLAEVARAAVIAGVVGATKQP
ncbi:hypothetical protein [Bradyrhizobium sp.]|uniref:hypothetical protein n=1 Tax=Bradyrhizobium sp. TaxID=376 RepID=UPI0025B806BE|nr:hypothetical protein [Bradyrhizobium sp.]